MFLTKMGLIKAIIVLVIYVVLGIFLLDLSFECYSLGIEFSDSLCVGIIAFVFGVIFFFWVMGYEGKGKLINSGNKILRKELKPAEFLKRYENAKNLKNLVINKPSVDVLTFVIAAYTTLNDTEKAFAAIDEMIEVAKEKNKVFAKLYKVSLLFSCGRKEEAEELFNQVQNQKMDAKSEFFADAILKSDRAVCMGDYKTAKVYYLKSLERKFPKLDNLGKLSTHYSLGEVYMALGEKEKAAEHYGYCAENGGETAMRNDAIDKIAKILKN